MSFVDAGERICDLKNKYSKMLNKIKEIKDEHATQFHHEFDGVMHKLDPAQFPNRKRGDQKSVSA